MDPDQGSQFIWDPPDPDPEHCLKLIILYCISLEVCFSVRKVWALPSTVVSTLILVEDPNSK
jgi:hypothetical protein